MSIGIPLYSTGIFSGQIIEGIGKQNKGCLMEIRKKKSSSPDLVYPPSLLGIANLSQTDITHKLRLIDFFTDMTPKERLEYLQENATENNDLYLSDVGCLPKSKQSTKSPQNCWGDEPFEARIIKIGGAFMIEYYSEVSPDEWFTIRELEEMVPLKPGSKGLRGRSTLIFRPGNFCISVEERKTEWNGLYLNLESKAYLEDGEIDISDEEEKRLIIFEDANSVAPDFAIVYIPRKEAYTWDELIGLAPNELQPDMIMAKDLLSKFSISPAFFKSLLQKIIRFRADTCSFIITQSEYNEYTISYNKKKERIKIEDERITERRDEVNDVEYVAKLNAQATLLAVVSHLIMHPGAFVPNIQRFVSGMESAFKRIAVSICEDSWTKKKKALLGLYCGAALAQREKNWIPSADLVQTLFTLAVEAQQEGSCFIWQLGEEYEYTEVDDWSACAMVLEHIKSFQSDIDMVRFIASTEGKKNKKFLLNGKMDNLFVHQAIDHHTNPEVAYFFPYEGRETLTYPELFKKMWDVSSGFNPRKRKFVNSNELEEIKIAQKLCMFAKFYNEEKVDRIVGNFGPVDSSFNEERDSEKTSRSTSASGSTGISSLNEIPVFKFEYKIDESWLAGLIGPIQIGNAFVVLRTDNITTFTAIKKPSRTDKVPELTEEEKEDTISSAVEILKKGVKLSKCPPCLDLFRDAKVKYDNEEEVYRLLLSTDNSKNKKWQDWEDCIQLNVELKKHEMIYRDFYKTIKDAIRTTGHGIEEYCFDWFDELISDMQPFILRRLLTTITGMATKINLQKIGRDGEGIDYTVYNYDTEVFRALCIMCNLFPAALEMEGIGFSIKNGPLFWKLRDLINEKIAELTEVDKVEWKIKKDKRKMWEHQVDIVNTMKERNKEGKKGHLIWMQMGSGKSMCVTQYIRYLIKEKKMPEYVIWTLPTSAIDSISQEIEMAGLEYKLLDCRKHQDSRIEKGVINIVRHDHLRLNDFDEQLKECAANTLFIVDEFHKTMNKTKRTSITLDIVKLSYDFIGLSGTIIKDNDVDQLIVWLQQICEFEVTKDNYWVAVGALISRKAETHVVVNREFVEVEQDEDYYKIVPASLGGTASQINFRAALQMSYDAVTEEIINQAKKYLKKGEKVFIVAKDVDNQKYIASKLKKYEVFMITNKNQITLGPEDEIDIDVVITTIRHCEGYTLSLLRIGITGCWFSNQSSRDQLLGRLNRLNQESDYIDWITVHSGILSFILEKYEKTRSLSESLRAFAKDIGIEKDEMKGLL